MKARRVDLSDFAAWQRYDMAEDVALRKTFEKHCLNYNDDIRNIYRKINSNMWKEFENGKIDKASLQTGRFERLLNECNYKADANEFNFKGGKDFGIATCWYNPNGSSNEGILPDYEIKNLMELREIILV